MRKLYPVIMAVIMLLATTAAVSLAVTHYDDKGPSELGSTLVQSSEPRRVAILLQGLGSDTDRAFCTWYYLEALLQSMGTYDDIVEFSYRAPGEPYSAEDTFKNVPGSMGVLRDTVNDYLDGFPQAEFDLIGHSLGGVVAFLYAASYGLQDPAVGHIRHVATLDSPVNGSYWLYIINSSQQADNQDELGTIWDELGLTSDAAHYLAMLYWIGFFRVSLSKAEELDQNAVMVRTFSSTSDLAVPISDALILDPAFQWSEDLGTDRMPGPCGDIQPFDVTALLGHNQILHHSTALQALRDFLSEAPTPGPLNPAEHHTRASAGSSFCTSARAAINPSLELVYGARDTLSIMRCPRSLNCSLGRGYHRNGARASGTILWR